MFSAIVLLSELEVYGQKWYLKPPSASIVMTRFICGFVLHIYLTSELEQGFTNMKYALNHPWKFEKAKIAFFAGFLQVSVVYAIEIVNCVLMLANNTHRDIVVNFIVLVIISQFDDFFY